jgi:hypothetical protein
MGETARGGGLSALVREPLLHYLLLGLLAYGLYSFLGEGGGAYEPPDRVLEFSAERIRALGDLWRKKWNRPPTEKELRGQIEALVREEILSREAIALSLDRDDSVVRRRLAQKLEYLIRDLAPPPAPTEAELLAFLDAEAERYRRPPRIAFTHVFFSPDRRGAKVYREAAAALARLKEDPDLDRSRLGDVILLEPDQPLERLTEIERRFGPDFAKGLDECPEGVWSGPVPSSYGLHLVRVTERKEGGPPALDEIRDEVRRDLMVRRSEEARRAFYENLRKLYRVDLDEEAIRANSLKVE